ncbi:unnamed protein product [Cuscuta epithymum]|uniref:FAD synthase n=1 Tax=Cuscuta epithymum TaxID=186058 RepID=A0AAV0C2H2_9ASTE|nr:unnamed protein product [Cuscuta epithymum]CAH9123295.1 unnamed protein product [Cuscuta epithymum]
MGSFFGILQRPMIGWNPSLLHCSNKNSSCSGFDNKVNELGVLYFKSMQPKSVHSQRSLLSDSLSQSQDGNEHPPERLSILAGGVVALGKFDALHIGHRELAIQAAKIGAPFLLSFIGMAEVLGWESRAPIVAKCDRKRVLSSWAPYCGQMIPREFQIEFSKVRNFTPRHFVKKLSKDLGVHGVVAGENYRFGYKASGDASDLVRLCDEYGVKSCIISSVMDKNQDPKHLNFYDPNDVGLVSSTRVRYALSKGDMNYVSELLGRHHRLFLNVGDQERFFVTSDAKKCRLSAPKSHLLNLPPREGIYENCSIVIFDKNVVSCRVVISSSDILLEWEKPLSCFTCEELSVIGIDIRGSRI